MFKVLRIIKMEELEHIKEKIKNRADRIYGTITYLGVANKRYKRLSNILKNIKQPLVCFEFLDKVDIFHQVKNVLVLFSYFKQNAHFYSWRIDYYYPYFINHKLNNIYKLKLMCKTKHLIINFDKERDIVR